MKSVCGGGPDEEGSGAVVEVGEDDEDEEEVDGVESEWHVVESLQLVSLLICL